MCEACAKLAQAIDAYIAKQDDDLQDDLEQEGYLNAKESVEEATSIEDDLADVLNEETKRISEQFDKADNVGEFIDGTWQVIQDASALADDIQEVFEEGFNRLIPKLVEAYLQDTDMYLVSNVISQRTTSWISTWSKDLGKLMKLTSHTDLSDILTTSLNEGKSVAETVRQIMDKGIRSNYTRARATAVTEMLTAHSVSRNEGLMQSPAVESKEWRHSGGRRNQVRKNHVAIDGQVVLKTEPFDLRGKDGSMYHPEYPRDTILPGSERINCHCIHRGIVNANVLGLPLEERKKLQQQAIEEDDRRWVGDLDEQNKAKAGITDPKTAINSLLPNANYGKLQVTRTVEHITASELQGANDVLEIVHKKGGISRYIYDDEGKLICRIDNNDHGIPKLHPFGDHGAHYARALYDSDGNFERFSRNMSLTAKMRRLCKDIIIE